MSIRAACTALALTAVLTSAAAVASPPPSSDSAQQDDDDAGCAFASAHLMEGADDYGRPPLKNAYVFFLQRLADRYDLERAVAMVAAKRKAEEADYKDDPESLDADMEENFFHFCEPQVPRSE